MCAVRGRGAAMRHNDERSDEAREGVTLAFPALCYSYEYDL